MERIRNQDKGDQQMSKLFEAAIERDRIRFGLLTTEEQDNPSLVAKKIKDAEAILFANRKKA
jgi:hypothetical protein